VSDDFEDKENSRPVWRKAWFWLLMLTVLAGLISLSIWRPWQAKAPEINALDLSPEALDARILTAEQQLQRAQRQQQNLEKKLVDAQSRNTLMRDELLAVNQRAALLEENLRQVASVQNTSRLSVQLEELESLLILSDTRLNVEGDLTGAMRALNLANQTAASVSDIRMINLKQSLLQEIEALGSIKDQKPNALAEINALETALPQFSARLPGQSEIKLQESPNGFRRLLDAMVQVRSADEQSLLGTNDRSIGEAALALEMAMARSALNKRDNDAFQASIRRIQSWLKRLYADGPMLRERLNKLAALSKIDIRINSALSGSSLRLLRSVNASVTAAAVASSSP
jgi:uroporphyrin-III C-methyltransferase